LGGGFDLNEQITKSVVIQPIKTSTMAQQQETFQLTIQINQGLEPSTFTVTLEKNSSTGEYQTIFKLSRDKDKDLIAILVPNTDHCWQQLKGVLNQQEVASIGAAIDAHFA